MDGEKRLSNITMIEIVCFLMGKQKISTGKQQKTWRGKFSISNLAGETDFLSRSTFYVGGTMFQRGRYWGCLNTCNNR